MIVKRPAGAPVARAEVLKGVPVNIYPGGITWSDVDYVPGSTAWYNADHALADLRTPLGEPATMFAYPSNLLCATCGNDRIEIEYNSTGTVFVVKCKGCEP